MDIILTELGKRLVDRWFSLLILPGLLFSGIAIAAGVLGQSGWADLSKLVDRMDLARVDLEVRPATLVLILLVVLLAAALAGLAAQASRVLMERVWLGDWEPFGRPLVRWRLNRWTIAANQFRAARDSIPPYSSERQYQLDILAAARNKIGLEPPTSPTWIGDRIRAVDTRVWKQYGLDFSSTWPRLWLVMPDQARAAVRDAREGFNAATALSGWGCLYGLLGVRWWPSGFIGVGVFFYGLLRGRQAAAVLADMAESVVDLYACDLAHSLDGVVRANAHLSPLVGRRITEWLRKGT